MPPSSPGTVSDARAASNEPNTATPAVPLMERKNRHAAVAVPRWVPRTEFYTARTSTGMTLPIPGPRTAMYTDISAPVIVTSMVASSARPTVAKRPLGPGEGDPAQRHADEEDPAPAEEVDEVPAEQGTATLATAARTAPR